MQNNRKLLFFDIDKTLLTPYPWAVPASARIALKKAHDNGHLLFVNSGRTYAMIPEIIRKIGFDGYVCGCGSSDLYEWRTFIFQFNSQFTLS